MARHHTKFWSRVTVGEPEACWLWRPPHSAHGYGRMRVNTVLYFAHRIAYMDCTGPIPEGLVIRHQCDVSACCNPSHLLAGTQKENMQDAVDRGRLDRRKYARERWAAIAAAHALTKGTRDV